MALAFAPFIPGILGAFHMRSTALLITLRRSTDFMHRPQLVHKEFRDKPPYLVVNYLNQAQ
jgi:hypothetical protein